jgi:hypothetical protein
MLIRVRHALHRFGALLALVLVVGVVFVPAVYSFVPTVHPYPPQPVLSSRVVPLSQFASPRNVILFYDDYPTRKNPDFQVTREIVEPLISHLDQDGKPTDWLFDSFIFYSVYLYYTYNPTQSYIDSWISYLFDGNQVVNLDTSVAKVKSSLNQSQYQMNVFLSVPVDVKNVQTSSITKNLDKMLKGWQKLSPKNLRLIGFYWGFTESLYSKDVESAIPGVASYLHARGLKVIMIPYYAASGINNLHNLGVDYVTVQPNYAWTSDSNLNRFSIVNATVSAGYADGVELELPVSALSLACCNGDWKFNLDVYLSQAATYNWNTNRVLTYYYGSSISSMWRSGNQIQYDALYEFIVSTR